MTKKSININDFISICDKYNMNCFAVVRHFIIESAHTDPERNINDIEISWYEISRCVGLKEQFINDYEDYLDWAELSEWQKLTEDQMRKHAIELDWFEISKHQKMSERFIREYEDYLNWDMIKRNMEFSKDFRREYNV